MDVIELIKKVKKGNQLVESKKEEIERLESICHGTGINYSGDKVTGSADSSRVEKTYLKYIESKDELKEYIYYYLEERKQLISLLDMLDKPKDIEVMYEYCLTDKSLKEVGDKLGYSKPSVHKIYKKSAKELQEKVDDSKRK